MLQCWNIILLTVKFLDVAKFITLMARPQVEDGGDDLQIWKVAVNILTKQSRTADFSLGVGHEDNNSSP
jgi:hypothetical protein